MLKSWTTCVRCWSSREFPRSYSMEFRGPEKIYLPIPGLPRKGVHQLFACAVRYPPPPCPDGALCSAGHAGR